MNKMGYSHDPVLNDVDIHFNKDKHTLSLKFEDTENHGRLIQYHIQLQNHPDDFNDRYPMFGRNQDEVDFLTEDTIKSNTVVITDPAMLLFNDTVLDSDGLFVKCTKATELLVIRNTTDDRQLMLALEPCAGGAASTPSEGYSEEFAYTWFATLSEFKEDGKDSLFIEVTKDGIATGVWLKTLYLSYSDKKYTPDPKVLRFIQNMHLYQYHRLHDEDDPVRHPINRDDIVESYNSTHNQFRHGLCCAFAMMLKHAFGRGQLGLVHGDCHIVWVDDDNISYDIGGVFDVEEDGTRAIWCQDANDVVDDIITKDYMTFPILVKDCVSRDEQHQREDEAEQRRGLLDKEATKSFSRYRQIHDIPAIGDFSCLVIRKNDMIEL